MQGLQEKIRSAQTVGTTPPEKARFNFDSIAELLATQAQERGDTPFLIYHNAENERSEYTYRDFYDAVRKTAAYMQSLGLKAGDRIATAAHNHPDTVIQYFAAWSIGLCVVPLNMTEDNERLHFILENSQAQVLFCREDYLERLPEFRPHTGLHVVPVYDHRFEEDGFQYHIERMDPLELYGEFALDEECLIVYTSGTTGNPKGVVLVQRNLMADAHAIADWHGIDESQVMMCVLPIHHVNGTIVTLVTPAYAGVTVVLNRKFQTQRFFGRIRSEGVNVVSVVPTLLAFLLENQADAQGAVKAGLRHIICGAGPLTCELARRFEDHFGIPIVHGYGLSETTCYSCFLPTDLSPEEHRRFMGDYGFPSIGIPLSVNDMSIHDENGRPVPEGERGEIVIRGSNVMKEYYHNPEANEKAFTFGWFRSGDEGFVVRDEAARPFYFITGRIKELIIRGGINLAPLEIDEVLNQAPGVKAGIAVGYENDFYGEEVGALVVPAHNDAGKDTILAYCASVLPFHKCPKVVVFTDALPVTSTGKYQRNKIKHLFSEWKAVQFRKQQG